MWRKSKDDSPESGSPAFPKSYSQPDSRARKWASRTEKQLTERATIGPSIRIKGEISGEGDMVIQGRVEGKVNIKKGKVTVAKDGLIKADIHGKVINVEGEVQGNLVGEEQVVVRESGVVTGDMKAPRIHLQEGAKFRGHVDHGLRGRRKAASTTRSAFGPSSELFERSLVPAKSDTISQGTGLYRLSVDIMGSPCELTWKV